MSGNKNDYKSLCRAVYRVAIPVIIILPIIRLFFRKDIKSAIELFISCIILSVLLWLLVSGVYGLLFFIIKPFRKKHSPKKNANSMSDTENYSENLSKKMFCVLGVAHLYLKLK